MPPDRCAPWHPPWSGSAPVAAGAHAGGLQKAVRPDGEPGGRSWAGEGRPRLVDAAAGPFSGRLPRRRAVGAVPAPRRPAEGIVPVRAATSRLGNVALTLAAVLGVVVFGLTVTAHVTGLRPLVVKSGSMEPTIPTGSMVLVRTVPASEIRVGDVVAVDRPDNTRVTHRVVAVDHQGRTALVTLKGDANEDLDPQPVVVDDAGKLVLSVPSIGRVSAFLASAQGGFVLGCIVTAVALPVLQSRREPSP